MKNELANYLNAEIEKLKATQRDLVAALEEIAHENGDDISDRDEIMRCADIAWAAIAKTKKQS